MLRRTMTGALSLLLLLALSSCGVRAIGYGVILWGDPIAAPHAGDVVSVLSQSPLNATCIISVPGDRAPREYPLGRVRIFGKKGDAAAFAASYRPQAGTWAVVMKEDVPPLPMRETPVADAKVVYKLQYKQLVKVVSRSAAQMDIKPYSDYWYEVATEDGYGGWCFGHFLKIFSVSGDPTAEARRIMSQDENLDRIMANTWRPAWFLDQVGRGAIDLAMFREDVGLFPSATEKIVKLVLPLSNYEFHYTGSPVRAGEGSYTFPGTDLRIDVLDPDGGRINVTYHNKEQTVSAVYALMKDDVGEVIAAEQKRRADIYDALVAKGATLASSAYGTVRLEEGMRFAWKGFSRLVPSLIGPNATGAGAVDFPFHVGKQLAGAYDGVITFTFNEYPDAGVSFLYKAAAGGLRLTSLARDSMQDLFVTHPALSPVVIFLTQSP
jgi:hypothetical protein